MLKFQKICNEFDIDVNKDFRFNRGTSGGLGTMYNYTTNIGYFPLKGEAYDPNCYQFIDNSLNGIYKIDYVRQDDATNGWKIFLLQKSDHFTRAGLVRLDDSIRTYVYCILGSQAESRSNIMTSAETQQTFVDLLEKNVSSMFSIPDGIAQYQESISNTHSKIDYVVATGLYMIPSNLVLNIGSIQRYNNNILIADKTMKLGYNENINSEVIRPQNIQSSTVKQPVRSMPTASKINDVVSPSTVYLYAVSCAIAIGICFYFRQNKF
jgi:hypothetical protein